MSTKGRKSEHLEFFHSTKHDHVQNTDNWLGHVRLVHQALPELDLDDIELHARFAGKTFDAPLMICAMTGGIPQAGEINRACARVAESLGIPFGLGSQRAMLEDPSAIDSYDVKAVAPEVFLLGNIGAAQLLVLSDSDLHHLTDSIGADALCVHLNSVQELIQHEGDRHFRGVLGAIEHALHALDVPVIVKEVGCGISRETARALRDVGIRHIDVAGMGGTNWAAIEAWRNNGDPASTPFATWGIPTAASLLECRNLDLELIGSGGIRTGLDVARALALGASICGMAAPILSAFMSSGEEGVAAYLRTVIADLKSAMLLSGCGDMAAMRKAPSVIGGELLAWTRQRGIST